MNTLVSIESYFWVHSFSRVSFSSWFSKSIVFLFSIKKFNFRFYNDTETWTSDWISFLIQIRKRCIYLEISFFFNYKNFFQNFNTYAYIWRTCLEYAYVYEKKMCRYLCTVLQLLQVTEFHTCKFWYSNFFENVSISGFFYILKISLLKIIEKFLTPNKRREIIFGLPIF